MGGKWSFSRIFEMVFQSLASDFEIESAGGCRGRPALDTRAAWCPCSVIDPTSFATGRPTLYAFLE